jgi:hypothetical protein
MHDHGRFCRNPRCGDWISRFSLVPFCGSCRLAAEFGLSVGAIIAFGLGLAWGLAGVWLGPL